HEYRTLKAAAFTGVGGPSLGGLAGLIAGLEYPRVFGNVAVMSPSVWWDGRSILGIVRAWRGRVRPRVWLDCGTAEGGDAAGVVDDLRQLREVMQGKGWCEGEDLSYCEV